MKDRDMKEANKEKCCQWIHSYVVPVGFALIWLIGVFLGKRFPNYQCLVLFFVMLLELLGVLLDVFVETKRSNSFMSYVNPAFILYAGGIILIVAILSFSQLLLENLFEYFVIGGLILVKYAQGWLSNNMDHYIVRIEKSSLKPILKKI